MKFVAKIFWVTALLWSTNPLIGQENKLFESLEDALTVHPDSVFRLDLSHSRLEEIPAELFRFRNLRELYLSKNKLSDLPAAQFKFEHLEVLDLSRNDFEIFPVGICNLSNLKQLLMGKNRLSALPECIGDLQKLEVLDVWFNTITELPESMTKMRKLKSVDMRGMNYSMEFQQKLKDRLPWVKFEFNLGCDCGY